MSQTFTEFIKEVLEPNFDGERYNISKDELEEYRNRLNPVEKDNRPLTFKGFPINKQNMKKIIPRNKYILVKPDIEESKENEVGLSRPENTEDEQKAQGSVQAVGSEIKDIKKGDQVVYGVFAGEVLKLRENGNEVDYKLLHDDDVIAFVK